MRKPPAAPVSRNEGTPLLAILPAADRWTWLVIACYAQLYLARHLAADIRLPWQRPCAPGRLTPARVRRGFRNIRQTLPCPARAPKPGKPGPGRPPGAKNRRPATRHGVGVQRIVETGTVDIVGVEPGRVEGLTGFRRANDAVLAAGAQINADAWSTAIVTAVSLAASLAAPNCRQIEIKPLRNPMQHELVTHPIHPIHPRDGQLAALSQPGLGITIDTAAVERHRMY